MWFWGGGGEIREIPFFEIRCKNRKISDFDQPKRIPENLKHSESRTLCSHYLYSTNKCEILWFWGKKYRIPVFRKTLQ